MIRSNRFLSPCKCFKEIKHLFMSKNKHTDFVSYGGQVNELANNTVSEMVREVNVCCRVSSLM